MKNQYFGDVNDYRKYGLLRGLQSVGALNLLVAWMLTHDDGGSDGRFRSYLQQPRRWKHFDSDLYSGLTTLLQSPARPRVSLLEGAELLPRSAFFSDVVPDALAGRSTWFQSLLQASSHVDLVFLDPDNGIEVTGKPAGRKGSSKYILWTELEQLWAAGCSLLVYQHFPRERRESFSARMLEQFRHRTSAPLIVAFRTAHVLFLLAGQPRHEAILREATSLLANQWHGQIDPLGVSAA